MTHAPLDPPDRPRLSRRALIAGVVGASALTAGVLAGCGSEPESEQTGITRRIAQARRHRAPEVSGTLLDGTAYDLATATAGKVVVLNFWGSWCGPCRIEAPDLEAVYRQSRAQGVEFVGITVRDTVDQAKAFVATQKLTYPSIHDSDGGRIALRFVDRPPLSTPATLIIDRQGRISSVSLGALNRAELQGLVDEMLAESPAGSAPAPSSGSAG